MTNDTPKEQQKPVTAERQKILDDAMEQLKKTRKEMDPTIFTKIRNIIAKNPTMMKALGITKLPNQKKKPETKVLASQESEKIDQEKNLDILAKFMTIKPSGKEGVKSMIEKSMKDQVKK